MNKIQGVRYRLHFPRDRYRCARLTAAVLAAFLLAACQHIDQPKVETFYSETVAPRKQELRWSNGKSPRSLDPATAIAAPETDIVRAVYEGLTALDSKTLKEVPAVAERWESSDDLRTWTFHLRKDAKWNNGERVTAADFVRSWKRVLELGDRSPNQNLLGNIVGARPQPKRSPVPAASPEQSKLFTQDEKRVAEAEPKPQPHEPQHPANSYNTPEKPHSELAANAAVPVENKASLGVEALDDATLKVSLVIGDKDFAKLVANPVFFPVYADGAEFAKDEPVAPAATNGPFRLAKMDDSGVVVERSDNYWDRGSVGLERVNFISQPSAESALQAYKDGQIDILSNANFEPLALKLLTPYEDFRRTTHAGLNFYEINTTRPPLNDRHVRAALALAIDRDKLADGDLEGATRPAVDFSPIESTGANGLAFDISKAKDLLSKAGYQDGSEVPPLRLVVNRNDAQQRIARSVVRMWKQNLNIDASIVVKETSEMDATRAAGDYDLIRRGIVFYANDELMSLGEMFGLPVSAADEHLAKSGAKTEEKKETDAEPQSGGPNAGAVEGETLPPPEPVSSLNEETAVYDVKAIPLYFPTSYTLVKPYVRGFDVNLFDAPSLKSVSIDDAWHSQPAK